MVRIIESGRAAGERFIIEFPFGRSNLPNQLREFVPVLGVAIPPALRGEIELVPPLEFGFWRQWHLAGFLVADQIATDGDKGLHALWPERRDNVRRASAPIEAG